VGEAAVEVVLVGPVLEVADPQRADLLQTRRLVVRSRHRAARRGGAGGGRRRGWLGSGCSLSLSCVLAVSFVFHFLVGLLDLL
jgi:hypothetical protein